MLGGNCHFSPQKPSLDHVVIHVVYLFLPFFVGDLGMPLDKSLVIDKSIFFLSWENFSHVLLWLW